MSSHAALGVVKAGVAVLKGTGVRVNTISAGLVLEGQSANGSAVKSAVAGNGLHLSAEMQKQNIGLERAGLPAEVGRVAGYLASGFSSYITGSNIVVDGGASVMSPLMRI